MSLVLGNRTRHRRILFAAVVIAASGYASYRLYNSSAFVQRRRKLLQIMNTMSLFGKAISESAESISLISKDLKEFLSSDEDTVPRSLRQTFKLGQCHEFQETATVLTAALTRGLLQGLKSKKNHGSEVPNIDSFKTMHGASDSGSLNEDVACREIREVCFVTKNEEESSGYFNYGSLEHELEGPGLSNLDEPAFDYKEQTQKCYSIVSNDEPVSFRQKGKKTSEEFSDRILSKLLSDPAVGFVSAVAGAIARNFVLAFFDGFSKESAQNLGGIMPSNNQFKAGKDADKKPFNSKFLDVMANEKCRALITECIQIFVSTAVTIYIEKTKDVNVYDDMVAGITNPLHRDKMKDVLTSLCNGAIETFVRTSYTVFFNEKNALAQRHEEQKDKWKVEKYSPHYSSQQQHQISLASMQTTHVGEVIPELQSLPAECISRESSIGDLIVNNNYEIHTGDRGGMQTFIEGVSRTLAIPSNRELAVDMAGKMSYEAMRSFLQVIATTISSYLRFYTHESWNKVKRHVLLDHAFGQLQVSYKDIAAKSFVLASICVALCLHILVGLRLLDRD